MTRPPYADAFATMTVLAWRLPMLWAMTWSATPQRKAEALRMVTEKNVAFAQGMTAAMAEASLSGFTLLAGRNPVAAVADAALRPALRRVRANARRLSRKAQI